MKPRPSFWNPKARSPQERRTIGRSTQPIGDIVRTKETMDIVASSPQSRRRRDPSCVPTMQKSGVRSIALQNMIWRSARPF
jgi:hypothetical protein